MHAVVGQHSSGHINLSEFEFERKRIPREGANSMKSRKQTAKWEQAQSLGKICVLSTSGPARADPQCQQPSWSPQTMLSFHNEYWNNSFPMMSLSLAVLRPNHGQVFGCQHRLSMNSACASSCSISLHGGNFGAVQHT